MSYWTHIFGMVSVNPMGRTQAEKTYILQTVLEHLPVVSGSECCMKPQFLIRNGHNVSCSSDEFLMTTNNVWENGGWLEYQERYSIVIGADLRDRMFMETYRELIRWLCRLSKRVLVDDVLIKITAGDRQIVIDNRNNCFSDMFEPPSHHDGGEPNWCEYLMWEPVRGGFYPAILQYKYVEDHENDTRVEAWRG